MRLRSGPPSARSRPRCCGDVAGRAGTGPSLRIASPTNDSYLSGPTRLIAMIDPPAAARDVTRVVFFADGRQVCTSSRQPFECEWEAGDRIAEHQIRAVATLRNGGRLVHTVRTRGLEYAETLTSTSFSTRVTDGDGRFGVACRGIKVSRPKARGSLTSRPRPPSSSSWPSASALAADAISGGGAAKQFRTHRATHQVRSRLNENIFPFARRATAARAAPCRDLMAAWGRHGAYDVISGRAISAVRQDAARSSSSAMGTIHPATPRWRPRLSAPRAATRRFTPSARDAPWTRPGCRS